LLGIYFLRGVPEDVVVEIGEGVDMRKRSGAKKTDAAETGNGADHRIRLK
jgi:hypothetical protein